MSAETGAPEPPADRMERARARSEAKNGAVRQDLEPLAPGERPRAVTVAALIALLFVVANAVAFALGDHPDDSKGKSRELAQLVFFSGVLLAAAAGMWRAKYWAVLGFQTILALQIIIFFLSIARAESIGVVFLYLAFTAAASLMFWHLIRAMARIQMPPAPERSHDRHDRRETPEDD